MQNVLRGDIVRVMGRLPMFCTEKGPVMAVCWPFHDRATLEEAQAMLNSLGYDTYIQTRSDIQIFELIIGRRKEDSNAC